MKTTKLVFLTVGMAAWALAGCATSEADQTTLDTGTLPGAPTALSASGQLRLMAGNITSGTQQAYEGPGIRIFQGLDPDVAMIQEFNYKTSSSSDLRAFVDEAFGPEFSFARGSSSQQIPNGVVSRYPILDAGSWRDPRVSNRDFVWARIDIPGTPDLYAVSVHLLTKSTTERNLEAQELVKNIQGLPADAYVVLAGDFNTGSRTEPALSTLSSVLTTTGPFPVDQNNVGGTNASRSKPYDWVIVDDDLQALETDLVIGSKVFPNGFVGDTRVYAPITDISPALSSDSGASNMQHMGVVRAFALSVEPPPVAAVQVTAPNGGETWAAGSSQTIRWTASNVTDVKVELSTDGATFTTLSASTPAANGQLAVTVPATATSSALVRLTAVGGSPSDVSDAAFTITVTAPPPPPTAAKVFINEVLANEPGSTVAGEFVELVNSGSTDADLSGWTISDSTGVRHTFASGTVLRAGRALVVFGGASGIPAGLTNAVAASTASLGLGNSGDSVVLKSPASTVDSVTYTSGLAGTDGVSMNRTPDGTAGSAFVLHTTLSAQPRSAGVRASGAAF